MGRLLINLILAHVTKQMRTNTATLLLIIAALYCMYQGRSMNRVIKRVTRDNEETTQTFENHIGLYRANRDGYWSKWNRLSPVEYENVKCSVAQFRPSTAPHISGGICIHPLTEDIVVSQTIWDKGRWTECDHLVLQWNEAQLQQRLKHKTRGSRHHTIDLYVDIGANIGSCLLEMIFSTDAFIVAFEPDPRNFAMITSTLSIYGETVRDRVALFPVGLSSSFARSVINTANNNRGNAVVGDQFDLNKVLDDHPDQKFLTPIPITIERLDDIFEGVNFDSIGVMLIKMDTQGLECHVIDGGERVFGAADVIVTESLEKWLAPQGCSVEGLLGRIRNLDFDVENPNGYDVIARKRKN